MSIIFETVFFVPKLLSAIRNSQNPLLGVHTCFLKLFFSSTCLGPTRIFEVQRLRRGLVFSCHVYTRDSATHNTHTFHIAATYACSVASSSVALAQELPQITVAYIAYVAYAAHPLKFECVCIHTKQQACPRSSKVAATLPIPLAVHAEPAGLYMGVRGGLPSNGAFFACTARKFPDAGARLFFLTCFALI